MSKKNQSKAMSLKKDAELIKQEEEGIIEKVTSNMGSTPWVANLVIVPKDKNFKNTKCSPSRPAANQEPQAE